MVKTMLRSTLREIRQSLGRYLAILAIVGLGVGFFAGLRMCQPSMIATGIEYIDSYRLYDFRLLSTLGFTQEDVDYFAGVDGVETARGAVYTEFLYRTEQDKELVLMAHSLTEGVNEPELMAGRMPERADECVGDTKFFTEEDLGKLVRVSDSNDEDTRDLLAYDGYTLVGLVQTPCYLNFERGTSSIGSGSVTAFVLIPEGGFEFDAYYEIFLTLADREEAYSDAYQDQIDALKPELEKLTEERADLRYTTLYEDAMREIRDGEDELADGWEEYRTERADAEQELADAYRELTDGEAEYADGLADYTQGKLDYADGVREIADAEQELADGWAEYEKAKAEAEQELADAKKKLEDSERDYQDGLQELEDGREELASGKEQLRGSSQQLDMVKSQLDSAKEELDAAKSQLDETKAQLDLLALQLSMMTPEMPGYAELTAQYQLGMAAYEAGLAQYEQGLAEYNEGLAQYQDGMEQLDAAQRQIQNSEKKLDEAQQKLDDARKELDDGWQEYYDGKAEAEQELADAYQELLDGEQELADAKAELADAKRDLDKAPGELADARQELDDGWQEYYDGKAEADEEFADAEQELADGQQEIDDAYEELEDLKNADTYVLTRNENTGYACFDNDTAIVAAISVVFPVFFFLVAALVCMTTMKRMVDEQRTQIGVLKAMGYSNGQIMGKYLFYSGSAALIGSTAGYALGSHWLPWIIWEIYGIMYGFAELKFTFDPVLAAISFAAALLCSMGATFLSCRAELSRPAAELIRPKTPKAGKRVFLEYITPLWKRLGFLQKVSVRNVLRYRSRLVMMVLGIGGCTALLVTGFGLRDSVASIVDDQYDQITLYDYSVSFREAQTREDAAAYLEDHGWSAEEGLLVHSGSTDVVTSAGSKSVYLVVSSTDSLEGFVSLHSGEREVAYPGPGKVVVNIGLAEGMNISRGDTIQLRDDKLGTLTVTVSDICDNYVYNYVYVSPETYRQQLGEIPEYQTMYLLAHDAADPYGEGVLLSDGEDVSSVSVNEATRVRVNNVLSRMDYIVIVVVVCAAALAFIVLYNLTNININERIREIATIKVLGFYQNEVASYVFREILMLSALGSLAGVLMGKALHLFVMAQIQVDGMYFPCEITPLSYLISLALTVLFTLLITCFMRPRLRRVDMAESLKSIE